ncbi:MAG: hypothetical protein AAF927_29340 [Bacteroidota bacterium]
MNKNLLSSFLKVSAVLWIIWGLVHVLAGVMTLKGHFDGDVSASIAGIADAVEASAVQMNYHPAASAIVAQHGFNLFWIGIVTFISAFYIWKKNANAIFLAAITGGLADVGYFLFLDLGGHVKFIPGTLMTIVSATAIILSFYAYFKSDKMAAFAD